MKFLKRLVCLLEGHYNQIRWNQSQSRTWLECEKCGFKSSKREKMSEFISVPDKTFCEKCHLWIAPFAEHIRFKGKFWHNHCWLIWYDEESRKSKQRLRALRRAVKMGRLWQFFQILGSSIYKRTSEIILTILSEVFSW